MTQQLRVALAGFGHVGRAVARVLTDGDAPPGLRLTTVCTRGGASRRPPWIEPGIRWTDDFDEVLDSDASVVVELIGGVHPAQAWIERALERGKSVVTANKQVIARRGPDLEALALEHGCHLRFEASVGGVVPIIRALGEGLAADRVRRIGGILNGTCNYVLNRIESSGTAFADAVAEAQASGFAEADPTADLDGHDARAKLAILATLAFKRRVPLDSVGARSIAAIGPEDFAAAREQGCTIRQVARAERAEDGVVQASVEPSLVPLSSALGRATGTENVIIVCGDRAGEVVFRGRGAGPEPTAVAVVSDLLSIAAGACRASFADLARPSTPLTIERI